MIIIVVLLSLYLVFALVETAINTFNKIDLTFKNGTIIRSPMIDSESDIISNIKKKNLKLVPGDKFSATIECLVLNTFFYKDVKFGIVVPVINNMLISVPSTIEISDNNMVVWNTVNMDENVQSKTAEFFKEYKRENKSKFLI